MHSNGVKEEHSAGKQQKNENKKRIKNMGKKIKWHFGIALFALFTLFATAFCGCSQLGFIKQINPETGEETTTWNAEVAQENVEKAQGAVDVVADATGQKANPFYILVSAALSLVSAGVGVAAKVQNSKKNKMLTALKETTLAAAEIIKNDGGDVKKLIDATKEIQKKTGTREQVRVSLGANENISKMVS